MQVEIGKIYEGTVKNITKYGAFVELQMPEEEKVMGMVHISEISRSYVNEIRDHVTENQVVKVKILNITEEGKISLSMKRAMDRPAPAPRRAAPGAHRLERPDQYDWNSKKKNENMSFEDMLSKFKQTSDDKMSDLKKYNEGRRSSGRRGSSK